MVRRETLAVVLGVTPLLAGCSGLSNDAPATTQDRSTQPRGGGTGTTSSKTTTATTPTATTASSTPVLPVPASTARSRAKRTAVGRVYAALQSKENYSEISASSAQTPEIVRSNESHVFVAVEVAYGYAHTCNGYGFADDQITVVVAVSEPSAHISSGVDEIRHAC